MASPESTSKMSEYCILVDTTSSTACSTVDGPPTPTDTIAEPELPPRPPPTSVPAPNLTFTIRHRDTGKVIALVDGDLRLADPADLRGGYHWYCVRTAGWFGFRNCVSGTYLGHNERKKFIATVRHHRPHEYFTPLHHPSGGYELLMRHGNEQRSMAVGQDDGSLVEVSGEGALFDFLEV